MKRERCRKNRQNVGWYRPGSYANDSTRAARLMATWGIALMVPWRVWRTARCGRARRALGGRYARIELALNEDRIIEGARPLPDVQQGIWSKRMPLIGYDQGRNVLSGALLHPDRARTVKLASAFMAREPSVEFSDAVKLAVEATIRVYESHQPLPMPFSDVIWMLAIDYFRMDPSVTFAVAFARAKTDYELTLPAVLARGFLVESDTPNTPYIVGTNRDGELKVYSPELASPELIASASEK